MKDELVTAPTTPVRMSDLDVASHLADPARKQAFVTPMFDVIAPRYDAFTRLFSFGMDARWKQAAISECTRYCADAMVLAPQLLDLATGTGDLAVGMAQRVSGAHVQGIDASSNMIDVARARVRAEPPSLAQRVRMDVGDMCALALPDNAYDVVMAGYGLRNVPHPSQALHEMRRVMRTGGRLMLLDFYRPESLVWRTLFLRYLAVAGNAVGWWWYRDPVIYGYIAHSIEHFISWQQCSELLKSHGFRVVNVTRYLGGGVARHDAIAE